MSSLTEKVAIVTASALGLGKAISLQLARDVAVYIASPKKAEAT